MKEKHIALIGIGIAVVIAIAILLRAIVTFPPKEEEEKIVPHEAIREQVSEEEEEETAEISETEEDWKTAQNRFKEWCLKNTSVTEIEFESDWQISVTLSVDEYTTDENIEAIAQILAGYYRKQSGYPHTVIVTVWSPDHAEYWKGFWE